jgi:hypothetical protein|eukprot:883432-Prymnesium_polylepis.1
MEIGVISSGGFTYEEVGMRKADRQLQEWNSTAELPLPALFQMYSEEYTTVAVEVKGVDFVQTPQYLVGSTAVNQHCTTAVASDTVYRPISSTLRRPRAPCYKIAFLMWHHPPQAFRSKRRRPIRLPRTSRQSCSLRER